jgi:hypothetical protein
MAYTSKFFAQAFCFKKLVAPEPAHPGKHTSFTDQTSKFFVLEQYVPGPHFSLLQDTSFMGKLEEVFDCLSKT